MFKTIQKYTLIIFTITFSHANITEWNINIDTESLYSLSFDYSNEYDSTIALLEIDGHPVENIHFFKTDVTNLVTQRTSKLLTKGLHNIKLTSLHQKDIDIKSLIVDVSNPVKLVIDTDMLTDSDDSAALAVAHALEDNGEAKILGVMLSAHDERHYNSNTVKAINNYYNGRNNNINIGVHKPILDLNSSTIPEQIKRNFRIDSDTIGNMHKALWELTGWGDNVYNYQREEDVVSEYYNILSDSTLEDNSLVIVVLGTNFNIATIMQDNRTKTLFSKKVKEVVLSAWMDSCNMNMCAVPIPSLRSDSYEKAKLATDYVINHMPDSVKLTVGDVSQNVKKHRIKTGQGYREKHIYSPMRVLYENDCANIDCSRSMLDEGNYIIDHLAVLVAVRGLNHKGTKYFDMHFNGDGYIMSNFVSDSYASWQTTNYKNHRVLKYLPSTNEYDTMLKNTINTLMTQDSIPTQSYPQNIEKKLYYIGLNPVEEIEVENIDETSIKLKWKDTSNTEMGFNIYQNNVLIASVDANTTSFTVTNLEVNRSYTYTITAFNNEHESTSSSIYALNGNLAWLIPITHNMLN
ncbi:MAG: fibronectin type III domain-containing protein [Campylobacterota bacterium]|nr:fibronectin type III domain-containing protein [Campylobacterota bacterium]